MSMNTPRFWLVENLPPYHVTQLNAFSLSTVFHGSPDPSSVTGKLTVWNATLSLPMNCTYSVWSAPLSRFQSFSQSLPVASAHSCVAEM